LSTEDGVQVPLIPFVEFVGRVGAVAPAHMVAFAPKVNVGVMF
jgi:hypothetical protein